MVASKSPRVTARELEVLRARCETGLRKGAAALLGISPETVRWHLGRLFARCGCIDDAQACYRHYSEIARTGDIKPDTMSVHIRPLSRAGTNQREGDAA